MFDLLANAEFWKSLSAIAWPVVVLIMFFAGKNLIKSLFSKDQINIEVAGMKFSIADAAKNIGKDLADLQQKVATIEQSIQNQSKSRQVTDTPKMAFDSDSVRSLSLIWVDDYPSNNAFLIDRLQQEGINVELSLSTADALSKIKSRQYDAIISDLERNEDGQNKPMAGLDLIKSVRSSDGKTPLLIYAGRRGLDNQDLLMEAGATKVTASATEVARFIKNLQNNTLDK